MKHVSILLTRCEKCFPFFDKIQIVLYFFDEILKNFNFPFKMLLVFHFFFNKTRKNVFLFGQDVKNVSSFLTIFLKIVLLLLTKCDIRFNFLDKM